AAPPPAPPLPPAPGACAPPEPEAGLAPPPPPRPRVPPVACSGVSSPEVADGDGLQARKPTARIARPCMRMSQEVPPPHEDHEPKCNASPWSRRRAKSRGPSRLCEIKTQGIVQLAPRTDRLLRLG